MADTPQQQVTNQKSNTPTAGQNAASIGNTSRAGKKYKRNRNRNRGKQKPGAVVQANRPPVREYLSDCCQVPAKKPLTGKPTGNSEKQKVGTKVDPTMVHGVGKWRCGACGKRCKVKPQAPAPKEASVA
jgi:hypothetical protein